MSILIASLLLLQGGKPAPVDPEAVGHAIDQGMEFLLRQGEDPATRRNPTMYDDLILYTLYHGGIDRQGEAFQSYLKIVLAAPLKLTYCVSLQAMFLSEYDPAKYQWRLAQCGQFLVDNQARNGMWSYGVEVPQPGGKDVPTDGGERGQDVATGLGGGSSRGPRPAPPEGKKGPPSKAIQVKRRQAATVETGDNSNTQYAVLGLRACMEARVLVPVETFKSVKKWLEGCQDTDGGWCYGAKDSDSSTGSMTAGAIGSLAICKYWLKENMAADGRIANGMKWLVKNWTVKANPGQKDRLAWHYYYLYGVERAGVLTDCNQFGAIDWYQDGAAFLLQSQQAGGAWSEDLSPGGAIKDSCFAILFLSRATVPLPKVATGQ